MKEALFTGLTLGLLLAISIGPIIFAIIKQSLNNGKKGGFLFVAGVSVADILLVLVCNLVSSFFKEAAKHQTLIGVCGSIFLVAMGIYTFFFKKIKVDESGAIKEKIINKKQQLGIFLSGFFMNMLNPGVFIFWLVTTTNVHTQALQHYHSLQFIVIVYTICLLFVLSTDIAKVLLAEKIRPKLTPHNLHIVNKISGIIFFIFAIVLAYATLNFKVIQH